MDIDPLEAEIIKAQPKASRVGFDSLLEDIFGLNIRSFKTMGVLVSRPARYFDAARDGDWLGRYTPSFRIWFGLMAVMVALRFVYLDPDLATNAAAMDAIRNDPDYADEPEKLASVLQILDVTLKYVYVFMPFGVGLSYAILAVVFRGYPGPTTFTLRYRYVLATVIPSTLFTLLTTPLLLFPAIAEVVIMLTLPLIIGVSLIDFVTAYRGTFAANEDRIGISFVYAILLFVALWFGYFLATLPAMVVAGITVFG